MDNQPKLKPIELKYWREIMDHIKWTPWRFHSGYKAYISIGIVSFLAMCVKNKKETMFSYNTNAVLAESLFQRAKKKIEILQLKQSIRKGASYGLETHLAERIGNGYGTFQIDRPRKLVDKDQSEEEALSCKARIRETNRVLFSVTEFIKHREFWIPIEDVKILEQSRIIVG